MARRRCAAWPGATPRRWSWPMRRRPGSPGMPRMTGNCCRTAWPCRSATARRLSCGASRGATGRRRCCRPAARATPARCASPSPATARNSPGWACAPIAPAGRSATPSTRSMRATPPWPAGRWPRRCRTRRWNSGCAVEVALTAALAAEGLTPAMVIGHSVGEVAAALAAGAVSPDQAVRIIHWRSRCQEQLRGLGTMAVLMLSRDEAEAALAEAGLHGTVVAAVNSPVCVTVSGPKDEIEALLKLAKQRRVAAQRVGVDYPFHSPLTAPIEAPLKAALADTVAAEGRIPFISAVTGGALSGAALDAEYWWRNIRQPVDFAAAARTALELGAGIFVEIGPRPVLTGHLRDIAKAAEREAAILPTLDNKTAEDGQD
ncbi:acyltransferase domain-containing protein, partial [Inquilinus sp. CA228]|uniref:acyltransferase domain-containing protein n=1 Tax=Inquilinus sp. CA228 TaxID=3455609 RepID=UPI003F8D6047